MAPEVIVVQEGVKLTLPGVAQSIVLPIMDFRYLMIEARKAEKKLLWEGRFR
jgi:hypothetical protein